MLKLRVNRQSLSAKLEGLRERAEEAALGKVLNVAHDAVQVSPVDTGAFVESWSILPKGSGGGRMKSPHTPERRAVSGRLSQSQKNDIREKQKTVLAGDLNKFRGQITKSSGAVVRNRAPHGESMKPQNGMNLSAILAYVYDRNS